MTNHLNDLIFSLNHNLEKIVKNFPNSKIGFMLGSTVSKKHDETPYPTPIRSLGGEVIFGAIVFNQIHAIVLASLFAHKVSKFYVDIEKKLPIDLNPNYEILKKYNVKFSFKLNVAPELGNISKAIREYVEKDKIIPYKANDLTVDAVWSFIASFYEELSGRKAVIFGLGNIGSKLSLKLVESGCEVRVCGKEPIRERIIVDGLNQIKNRAVLASIAVSSSLEFELLTADVLILAANATSVISKKQIQHASKCTLVIDIGKGNLDHSSLNLLIEKGVPVWRADISTYLPVALSQHKALSYEYTEKFGRRSLGALNVVSGGYVGMKNDLVVDNYANPTLVHGVCDGNGGIVSPDSTQVKDLIAEFHSNLIGPVK